MAYIKRTAERLIKKLVSTFKIVLVTGPRQVGKSTMLKYLYGKEYEYITFDDINELSLAKSDAKLFFINHPGKLIIDEVQLCPEIFIEIKRIVDSTDEVGRFILTGSQTFSLMQNVSESLAGRVGIMELKPLSTQEIIGNSEVESFKPSVTAIKEKETAVDYSELWNIIHRGAMPELYHRPDMDWEMYYASYLSTFIQRDVRQLAAIQDLNIFNQFISVLAARTSQEVNYASIAQEVGVDQKTIKSWIGILEASGMVYIINTYSNNQLKRVTKAPVLYFFDTGLVAYLGRWTTPQTLQNGAFAVAILENYCVSEILKSYSNQGKSHYPIYFYRDKDKKEIDLIIEDSGVLYPIEIKHSASPNAKMAKHMAVLEKAEGFKVGIKTILAQVEKNYLIAEDILVYAINRL
ncbi:ATP-binding protein [Aerococcaceae bacterium zg-B36]|uniref:ATP-binding protein n=1 Tax=Aerococcaceae bacterium zg-252 TaxID=2796928 RepID=UPI001BD903AA|nr:ATP-binding protein [Aerococcaceae bacterium zg-B36]